MPRCIISEGKTTNEAIENGLKQLKVSKLDVDIKVIEEEKRSFFSILTPRTVKVELTVKEEQKNKEGYKTNYRSEKNINVSKDDLETAKQNIDKFLIDFISKLPSTDIKYEIKIENNNVFVDMYGNKINYLIGYRGETLNSFQIVLNAVANRNINGKIRVNLDIENYRNKRIKALEELAEKISKTVIRTGKSITLEPMVAYERKIIHSKLQNNNKVKTYSIGIEPHRRIVVALK